MTAMSARKPILFSTRIYRSLQRHRPVFTAIARLSMKKKLKNHGRCCVKYEYLLPTNSLFDSHCLHYRPKRRRPFKMVTLYT